MCADSRGYGMDIVEGLLVAGVMLAYVGGVYMVALDALAGYPYRKGQGRGRKGSAGRVGRG